MITLRDLLQPWIKNSQACDVLGMQNDSRQVVAGDLFLAYPGAATDGRRYMNQAVQQGACAIVYDPADMPQDVTVPHTLPCIPFPQLATQLATLASRFFHNPSDHVFVTGITGTNGKTTIAYQLAQAHALLQRSAAYIGTLGYGQAPDLHVLNNTTPDALMLQRILYSYQQQGIAQVCMEVSSHALHQQRVDHIAFREAIYTNLSHEHLDYHQTMLAYAQAKASLFAKPSLKWVILNQDDPHMGTMAAGVPTGVQQWTYGIQKPADVRAVACHLYSHGTCFTVTSPWGRQEIKTPILGLFNIYNSLAVYTSLLAHGYSQQAVGEVMAILPATPGRMEIVAHNPYVIVDFAHTPAALENVMKAILDLRSSGQAKVWVVFGCGGNRDKTKRPLMGKIVSELADQMIVTSDNPRHEEPEAIIQDIVADIKSGAAVTTIINRAEAIHYALSSAARDDIVLIAGKGHEPYQIIGDEHLVFSDQDEVRRFFK